MSSTVLIRLGRRWIVLDLAARFRFLKRSLRTFCRTTFTWRSDGCAHKVVELDTGSTLFESGPNLSRSFSGQHMAVTIDSAEFFGLAIGGPLYGVLSSRFVYPPE